MTTNELNGMRIAAELTRLPAEFPRELADEALSREMETELGYVPDSLMAANLPGIIVVRACAFKPDELARFHKLLNPGRYVSYNDGSRRPAYIWRLA